MYTIFYFSGTGNTWLLAKEIEKTLSIKDKVACYSIENELLTREYVAKLVHESEQIIIGYPIYGSEAPEPMEDFIRDLPVVENKNVAVFCTQAFMSGDGANYMKEFLSCKGYTIKQSMEFIMSNNFYVPVFIRAFKVGTDEKVALRHEKALNKLNKFIYAIAHDQEAVKKDGILGRWLGESQRRHIQHYIRKVNDSLYADKNCIHCGLCVELCPKGNIELNGKVKFTDYCIGCMRCYQSCPVSAIQITEASKDKEKYPRYKGPVKKFDFKVLRQ